MANAIIKNGTNSRWRTVKEAHKEWICQCLGKINPGWRGTCPECSNVRPT